MATNNKYDRQLRLWGANGQKALSEARICLLNAGPTGTETVKNLVLPGVGYICVVDDALVTEADCANNFFVTSGHIGQPRAKVALDLLLEMNSDVRGDFRVLSPRDALHSDGFFKSFTLVIATQMSEAEVAPIAACLFEAGIPLVVARSFGLIGHVRLVAPEHRIVESKPDALVEDLRLDAPFPALAEYAHSFDLNTLTDGMLRAHVPYVALLIQAVNAFKAAHDGRAPSSRADRAHIVSTLESWRTDEGAANFAEALDKIHLAVSFESISDDVRQVLDDDAATQLSPTSDPFWFIVRALRDFAAAEGARLPVSGAVPDMTATSDYFRTLQMLFKTKAAQDTEAVATRVAELLSAAGAAPTHVSSDLIRDMCQHARVLRVMRYRSIASELDPATACKGEIAESFDTAAAFGRGDQAPAAWYIALRACDAFQAAHGRVAGASTTLAADADDVWTRMQELCTSLELADEQRALVTISHAKEMVRFGGAELHTTAAFVGGVASQEIVKLITHQFVPLNNTFIMNGINGTASSMLL